jgi:hypothetical protein
MHLPVVAWILINITSIMLERSPQILTADPVVAFSYRTAG